MSDTLRLIVQHTLSDAPHPLKERTIAVQALGRPAEFDPRVDPAVRVQVGRLRTALDRYYETVGASDPLRIFVPKGAYRAVFAPAADRSRVRAGAGEALGPTVAVTRLVDHGVPAALPHLASGLAEALVAALSSYPGVRVAGPLDAVEPTGPGGPDFVLTGSIRSSRQSMRVAVRLHDGRRDRTCWSWQHDVALDDADPIQIEDRVVSTVAPAVGDLRGAVLRHAVPSDALPAAALSELVSWFDDLDPVRAPDVLVAVERAVGAAPWSADLLALLAEAERLRALTSVAAVPRHADLLARRALAMDHGHPLATLVLATCDLERGDRRLARANIEVALRRSPHHPWLLVAAGWLHARLGDWTLGLELVRSGLGGNPAHPGWHRFLPAMDAWRNGDFEAALGEARHMRTPGWLLGPLARAAALSGLGRGVEAHVELASVRAAVGGWDERRHSVLTGLGLPDDVARDLGAALDTLAT